MNINPLPYQKAALEKTRYTLKINRTPIRHPLGSTWEEYLENRRRELDDFITKMQLGVTKEESQQP